MNEPHPPNKEQILDLIRRLQKGATGKHMREARNLLEMSQADFAALIFFTAQHLSRLETDARIVHPRISALVHLLLLDCLDDKTTTRDVLRSTRKKKTSAKS